MRTIPGLPHWRVFFTGSTMCFRRVDGEHFCQDDAVGCIGPRYSELSDDEITETIEDMILYLKDHDLERPLPDPQIRSEHCFGHKERAMTKDEPLTLNINVPAAAVQALVANGYGTPDGVPLKELLEFIKERTTACINMRLEDQGTFTVPPTCTLNLQVHLAGFPPKAADPVGDGDLYPKPLWEKE